MARASPPRRRSPPRIEAYVAEYNYNPDVSELRTVLERLYSLSDTQTRALVESGLVASRPYIAGLQPARKSPLPEARGCRRDDEAMPAYESWASSPASRKVMQGNRSRDTSPELAVRRLLHAAGLRYRVDYRPEPSLRRTADIVFTKQRVAIFIDGCYWHACPEHGTRARANADYWSAKMQRNVARDADTTARLEGGRLDRAPFLGARGSD